VDWLKIRAEYETTGITLNSLADKHGLKYPTVKSRKQREQWKKDASIKRASKVKKDATKVADKQRASGKKQQQGKADEKKKIDKVTSIEESPALTEMQRLFCLYFVKNRNATLSAIKAGYAKDSAHVRGSELVRNSKVAAEINRLRGSLVRDLYMDAKDLLEIYVKIAAADPTDYFEFGTRQEYVYVDGLPLVGTDGEYITRDVNFVRIKNSDEIDGSLMQEIKQTKDGISIKFVDKHKALEVLKDYFDLTPDQHRRKLDEANLKLSERRLEINEADLELRRKQAEDGI